MYTQICSSKGNEIVDVMMYLTLLEAKNMILANQTVAA